MSIESAKCLNDYNVEVKIFHDKLLKILLNILQKPFIKGNYNDNKRQLAYKSLLYQSSINGNTLNLICFRTLFSL